MIIKELNDYVLYDTETTGLDINTSRIVEHGVIKVRNNVIVEELRLLVKQSAPIPRVCVDIHGITDEMCAKDGIEPKDAAMQVVNFMADDVVVGMNNIPYDGPLLQVEVNRFALPRPKIENWFDIGMYYKGICLGNLYNEKENFYLYANRIKEIRARIKYNLNHLVKTLGVENLRDDMGGKHGAIADLKMTHHVFQAMKIKYCTL